MNQFLKGLTLLVKKIDIIPFCVWLFSFVVYFLTLAPTISTGDGAELITAAYTFGVAHSPGYPLFTILAKVFMTIIPFGSIAWRVNFMDAFFGSITVLLVYLIIKKILVSEFKIKNKVTLFISPITGALFLAFSSGFWFYSITAEVFSLHHLFIALLVYILLIWREKIAQNSRKWLYLFCFVAGLSSTNQQTIVFLAPVFLFLIFITQKKVLLDLKSLVKMVGLFVLGFSPYLYIFIVSKIGGAFYWAKPDSFLGIIHTILRESYGGIPYPKSAISISIWDIWAATFCFYLKSLYFHFTIAGFILGAFGIFYLYSFWNKKRKTTFLFSCFILSGFLFSGFLLLFYLGDLNLGSKIWIGVAERFAIASEIFFALFIAFGFCYIFEKAEQYFKKVNLKMFLPLAFLFLIPLSAHYFSVGQSKNYLLYDFGNGFLDMVDKNALVLSQGDMMFFSSLYLQNVEQKRTDVRIIHEPLLGAEWYVSYLKEKYPDINIPFARIKKEDNGMAKVKEIINENIKDRSVYCPMTEDARFLKPEYFLLQRDFLFQVSKGKPVFSPNEYIKQNNEFYKTSKIHKDLLFHSVETDAKYPFTFWDYEIRVNFATSHSNKCLLLKDLGLKKDAETECLMAIMALPEFLPAYSNLGVLYVSEGLYEKAISAYENMVKVDPVNLTAYKSLMSICRDNLKDEARAQKYLAEYINNRITK